MSFLFLQVLHGMLVDPPIAIVGLSNWVLDPAKMNRAVLVQRPEPSNTDIAQTGASILGLEIDSVSKDQKTKVKFQKNPLMHILKRVSRAFFAVYTSQKGERFYWDEGLLLFD